MLAQEKYFNELLSFQGHETMLPMNSKSNVNFPLTSMSIELLILAKHLSSEHFKTCSTTIDKVVIIILMKFCHYITDIRVLGHANKP